MRKANFVIYCAIIAIKIICVLCCYLAKTSNFFITFIIFIKNVSVAEVSVFVYLCVCDVTQVCVCAHDGSSHLTCPTHTGRERERKRKTSADLLMAVL